MAIRDHIRELSESIAHMLSSSRPTSNGYGTGETGTEESLVAYGG
ncbi:MAG: hypothetical protein WB676_24830 [Bryobacteraceae bacterium]